MNIICPFRISVSGYGTEISIAIIRIFFPPLTRNSLNWLIKEKEEKNLKCWIHLCIGRILKNLFLIRKKVALPIHEQYFVILAFKSESMISQP